MTFADKNANRKAGRSNGTRAEQVEARRLRRERKGAFGHSSAWNTMIPGTTGARR